MSTHRAPSQPLRDLTALVEREAFTVVWWSLMVVLMLVAIVLGSLL